MAQSLKVKKEKNIGARVSVEFFDEIASYLSELDFSLGHLIRVALREYMWSHPLPVKQQRKPKKEKA